jgi:uncharacterized membrane protein YheB (UPF0754 family)
MLEFKVTEETEKLFLEHINEIFNDNPILLDNIIKCNVEKMCDDVLINKIKKACFDKIEQVVEEAMPANMQSEFIEETICEIIENRDIDDVIVECVGSAIDQETIDETISSCVSEDITQSAIESCIEDQIRVVLETESDMVEDAVKTSVDNNIDRGEVSRIIEDHVGEVIDSGIDIQSNVTEYIHTLLCDDTFDFDSEAKKLIQAKVEEMFESYNTEQPNTNLTKVISISYSKEESKALDALIHLIESQYTCEVINTGVEND